MAGGIDWISGRIRDEVNHIAIISVEISPSFFEFAAAVLNAYDHNKILSAVPLVVGLNSVDSTNLEREASDRIRQEESPQRGNLVK